MVAAMTLDTGGGAGTQRGMDMVYKEQGHMDFSFDWAFTSTTSSYTGLGGFQKFTVPLVSHLTGGR